jgi:hypothetical protein
MISSYTKYVVAQSRRNPCLQNLRHFLVEGNGRNECTIASLAFISTGEAPSPQNLDMEGLRNLLGEVANNSDNVQGRILIIQDLTKDLIELLGSTQDVDPLFFASHIHGPSVDMRSCRPPMAILPSRARGQNFLSLQHQRVLEFENRPLASGKMTRDSNVPRRIAMLPPANNHHIGLAQYCCSVMLTSSRNGKWLGEPRKLRAKRKNRN